MTTLTIGDSLTRQLGWAHALCAVNLGRAGQTAAGIARKFDTLVQPYLAPQATVHIMLGTNDAWWRVSEEAYRRKIRTIAYRCLGDDRRIVLSSPPHTNIAARNSYINRYAASVVQLTNAYDWIERGILFPYLDIELGPDGVHPTTAGYVVMADALRPQIGACE